MPPYPKKSAEKDMFLREMIGKACYAEIALRAGMVWEPITLERTIGGKSYLQSATRINRIKRGTLPEDKTVKLIESAIYKNTYYKNRRKCRIKKWRDHPFWKLLSLQPLTYQDTERALLSVQSRVKHRIWLEPPSPSSPSHLRPVRLTPEKKFIEEIAEYKNFDAFVTLLAFVREAYGTNMGQLFTISAKNCLDIFPHVMIRHPQLYIVWKPLAQRLIKLIWKPKASFTSQIKRDVTVSSLRKRIDLLDKQARKEGKPLPPKDIIDRYN